MVDMTPREMVLLGVVEELRVLETSDGQVVQQEWRAFGLWRPKGVVADPYADATFHLRWPVEEERV